MSLIPHLFQALFLPDIAHALSIDCPACTGTDLGGYLEKVPGILREAFAGLLVLMIVLYGGKMIAFSQEESTIAESKSSLIYGAIAGVVVALAEAIAAVTSPGRAEVNAGALAGYVDGFADYFNYIAFAVVVANTVVQALRLASSHGSQERISSATKRLIYGVIGGLLAVVARQIVVSVSTRNFSPVLSQIQGFLDAVVEVAKYAAPTAIGIAGLMLIISVDESLKEKAKTVIKTVFIALTLILVADIILQIPGG